MHIHVSEEMPESTIKTDLGTSWRKPSQYTLLYQYFSPCPVTSSDILRENVTCPHRDSGYSGTQTCVLIVQGLVNFFFRWQKKPSFGNGWGEEGCSAPTLRDSPWFPRRGWRGLSSWSRYIHNQKAESDERLCPAHLPLFTQPGAPAQEAAQPTFRVDLHTSAQTRSPINDPLRSLSAREF